MSRHYLASDRGPVSQGQNATSADFATLRAKSGGGGRTVASVGGIGTEAFSVSRNGVPGGFAVLTSQGQLISITANIPIARDEALARQLMQRY
jgi:hypothetical protein